MTVRCTCKTTRCSLDLCLLLDFIEGTESSGDRLAATGVYTARNAEPRRRTTGRSAIIQCIVSSGIVMAYSLVHTLTCTHTHTHTHAHTTKTRTTYNEQHSTKTLLIVVVRELLSALLASRQPLFALGSTAGKCTQLLNPPAALQIGHRGGRGTVALCDWFWSSEYSAVFLRAR